MRILKTIFFLILTVAAVGTMNAQKGDKAAKRTAKLTVKAAEQVQKLDDLIVAGDASLALSAEQRTEIQERYLALSLKSVEIRAAADDKQAANEEIKALRKSMHQGVGQEILSQAQRKARNEGRKKLKE